MADDTPFFAPAASPYSSSPALAVPDAYLAALAGDTALDMAAVVAALATSPKDASNFGIRLIRAAGTGRFTHQLKEEWEKLTAEGKVKADYAQTGQARTLLGDALEGLTSANFDDEQLDLLRKLFLAAASETVTDRNNMLAREYMNIGRSLATGEIRVLAAYSRYLPEWLALPVERRGAHGYGVHEAMAVVQKYSGLKHAALIERHEKPLIEKGLVRPFGPVGGSAQADQKLHRLTDFGFAFCEFLKGYDRMKGESASE